MSFSKNFYPTNRNEECFCGDKSGKCRHSKDDPNFKACMTFRDARLGQREGDWICVLEMAAEWSYWRLASSIELKSPEFREAAREAKKQQAVEKRKRKDSQSPTSYQQNSDTSSTQKFKARKF